MAVTYQKLAGRVKNTLDAEGSLNLSTNDVHRLLLATFGEIITALSTGEDIYLEGFGRLYPDCRAPKHVKSGLTKEEHTTGYKIFVRFNAFKNLNVRVQSYLEELGLEEIDESTTPTHA